MSLLLAERVVRIWDAACMKALQKDVDDKKAERETLLHVGYIRHVCMRLYYLFLDCKYIIYWHLYVVVSLLRQLAHNSPCPVAAVLCPADAYWQCLPCIAS